MKNKRLNKENILTIPNLLSLFRLLLIPLILWLYCGREAYLATLLVIALSGFTDILDGKVARKYNMVSDVGKVLDPVADKLTQASLVICLLSRYQWMWGLLVIFILKESLMLLWGYLALRYTDTVNSAKWYGKLSTVVLYAVMMVLVLLPDIPEAGANALIALCAGVILLSLTLYGRFYHGIFRQSGSSAQKVLNTVRTWAVALLWVALIVLCVVYRKEISVEGIARFTPRNHLLAAIFMLLLFALKSMSVVIYSGLLYAANGILFPLPAAILLNILGSVIMFSLPYTAGKKAGASAVEDLRKKHPKIGAVQALRGENDFLFAFLARMARLPSDVVSIYMGAVNVKYPPYLLGSLLGLLPHMVLFPIMGMEIGNVHSPAFLTALGGEIAYVLITMAVYALYRKRKKSTK